MTTDEAAELVARQEDNFIERKSQGVKPADVRKTITAFANTVPTGRCAFLIVGINDKTGAIEGVDDPDGLQKRLRSALDDCYPDIMYSADVIELGGRHVVIFSVPHSPSRPHFSGAAFVRVGSESLRANVAQYDELIHSRVDPVGTILRHKESIFTVLGLGYKLGSGRYLAEAGYRERCECRLVSCDAHVIRLHRISDDVTFSEPMGNVTLNHDDANNRLELRITFPKPS